MVHFSNPGSDRDDARLVERYLSARPSMAADCPSLEDLAAYIDGRTTEPLRDSMESHLAVCPACLATVGEARAIVAEADPAEAPAVVIDAARRLVQPPSTVTVRRAAGRWLDAAGWGLAAAASIAVCLIGFHAGSSMRPSAVLSDAELVAEVSFGVLDDASNPAGLDFDLLTRVEDAGGDP